MLHSGRRRSHRLVRGRKTEGVAFLQEMLENVVQLRSQNTEVEGHHR